MIIIGVCEANRVLTFLLIVSIGFLCSFYNPDWAPVEYKNNDFTYADSYAQMFDAFYQGRTNLKASRRQNWRIWRIRLTVL